MCSWHVRSEDEADATDGLAWKANRRRERFTRFVDGAARNQSFPSFPDCLPQCFFRITELSHRRTGSGEFLDTGKPPAEAGRSPRDPHVGAGVPVLPQGVTEARANE